MFIDQGWLGEGGEQQEAHVDLTVATTSLSMPTFIETNKQEDVKLIIKKLFHYENNHEHERS